MIPNPAPRINLAAIPNLRRLALAKGALALTEQDFSMPGARERYQEWLKEYRARPKNEAYI